MFYSIAMIWRIGTTITCRIFFKYLSLENVGITFLSSEVSVSVRLNGWQLLISTKV